MKYKKGRFFYRLTILVIRTIFKIFYWYRVYGSEHYIPGSALVAPNHVSFFDPPAIAIACPEAIHFLARHTLFKSVLGFLIRRLNTHPVQRDANNLKVMKEICKLLQEGKKVLLFPEGTRSPNNELGEIKPGIGVLVSRSESAVLPVHIQGTFEIWDRKRRFPKPWGRIAVVFGSPIQWQDYADMDKKEAQVLIAQHLAESLTQLRKWYENGAEGSPP